LLPTPLSFALAPDRVDSGNLLLHHKTTARILFEEVLDRLKLHPGCFDALFFNHRGELTEGARSNVFLVKDGIWFTPPLESGLLDGIMRQEILRTRRVLVQKLYPDDLLSAKTVYLSNALRGLVRVSLDSSTENYLPDPGASALISGR
jgi:para-aminobenzoate synthetase/4-amino-4-deoxychorismate lyase